MLDDAGLAVVVIQAGAAVSVSAILVEPTTVAGVMAVVSELVFADGVTSDGGCHDCDDKDDTFHGRIPDYE